MDEIQASAAVLAAFIDEWIPDDKEAAKSALAACLRKAMAAAPYRFCSGGRYVNFGVISAVASELEGPLAPDLFDTPTPTH